MKSIGNLWCQNAIFNIVFYGHVKQEVVITSLIRAWGTKKIQMQRNGAGAGQGIEKATALTLKCGGRSLSLCTCTGQQLYSYRWHKNWVL